MNGRGNRFDAAELLKKLRSENSQSFDNGGMTSTPPSTGREIMPETLPSGT